MELPNLGGLRINEGRNGAADARPVETSGNAKRFIETNLPNAGWEQTLDALHDDPLLRPTQMVLTLLGVLVESMELDAFLAALCVASVECWRHATHYTNMAPLEAHLPKEAARALRRCAEGAGSGEGAYRTACLELYRLFIANMLPGVEYPTGAMAFEALAHVFASEQTKANVAFAYLVHEFFVEHLFRTRYAQQLSVVVPGVPTYWYWGIKIPRTEFYRLFRGAPDPADTPLGRAGWKGEWVYENADALVSFLTGGDGSTRKVLGFRDDAIVPEALLYYDNTSGAFLSNPIDPDAFDTSSFVHALFMATSRYEQALGVAVAPAAHQAFRGTEPRAEPPAEPRFYKPTDDDKRTVYRDGQGYVGYVNRGGRVRDARAMDRRHQANADVSRSNLYAPVRGAHGSLAARPRPRPA